MIRFFLVGCFGLVVLITQAQSQTKVWTLEDCINYALQENVQIKQAKLGSNKARLNHEQAKAAVYPSAQAGISYNVGLNRSLGADGKYGSYASNSSSSYSVNSSVTLFNGFKLKNQIKQSELVLKSNEFYAQVVKESVELNILDAYLQVLYAQESVDNATKQIELTQQQLVLADERLKLSAISQSDYLQIKSELANENLTYTDAGSQLILAKINLMQLMELPVDNEFEVASPNLSTFLNAKLQPNVVEVYNTALNNKPEIQQAQFNEKSALLDKEIAKASLYPSLSLNAGLGTNYSGPVGSYSYLGAVSNAITPTVGLSLSIPIYQKKQAKTNIGLARIGAEEAVLNTINTKNTLRKEVEQAAANVTIAQQQ
jgi:outer membrane protein